MFPVTAVKWYVRFETARKKAMGITQAGLVGPQAAILIILLNDRESTFTRAEAAQIAIDAGLAHGERANAGKLFRTLLKKGYIKQNTTSVYSCTLQASIYSSAFKKSLKGHKNLTFRVPSI